jgi:micrococcal nuclease
MEKVLIFRVVDGDTVDFYYLVPGRARLNGINAPELKGATREAGERAKAHLESLLFGGLGKQALVDVELHGSDKYGRALMEIFGDNGASINAQMVRDGHAVEYTP